MSDNSENILIKNRRAFTARQSMDALIYYARYTITHPECKTKKYISEKKDSSKPDSLDTCRSASQLFPTWFMYCWYDKALDGGLLALDVHNFNPNNSFLEPYGSFTREICALDVHKRTRDP